MNKNVSGFVAGLGIFSLCAVILYSNLDSITDTLCEANVGGGDCGNAGLFAFLICIPSIAIIAGVIGWIVVAWLVGKNEAKEDSL